MQTQYFNRRRRYIRYTFLGVLYTASILLGISYGAFLWFQTGSVGGLDGVTRIKRGSNSSTEIQNNNTEGEDDSNETCTERAIDEFPGNFLTLEQTQAGGVVVHILLVLYTLGALSIVCDDYFCASLEVICAELHLREDVAGATFMAAGSSASEFFTTVIGVFIAESDVGVGTIVGTAVFNVLFVVAICGLFTGMVVHLTWYPVLRDCIAYSVSVIALIIAMYDNQIYWYESLLLSLMYVLYIVMMVFNSRLENTFYRILNKITKGNLEQDQTKHPGAGDSQIELTSVKQRYIQTGVSNSIAEQSGQKDVESEKTKIETEIEKVKQESNDDTVVDSPGHQKAKEQESPWDVPDSWILRVFWVMMLPMIFMFYVTIPDCRRPGKWRKTYPLTFLISITWLGVISYVLVWMATVAGDAIDLPESVMGLTVLAAGESIQDCLASLYVARDGFGDMAIANTIGSNVFDVLMCLGLPWLLKSAISSGAAVEIKSRGLIYSTITVLGSVMLLIVAIVIARCRLDKKLGAICMMMFLLVITLSCLYETNTIGDFGVVNYCARE
ncbi:sodium/potassium/calcium exchanger 5-like [Ostrea edulis]|uniref:sodium/potassium/calcium exchanger 5-like n=1 Tax=Ostrea edulis TaxID=37623 RepID=UPI0024AFD81B|nr:sodium/potassium/calcium exchanger 5-like [Ostrea edulis]